MTLCPGLVWFDLSAKETCMYGHVGRSTFEDKLLEEEEDVEEIYTLFLCFLFLLISFFNKSDFLVRKRLSWWIDTSTFLSLMTLLKRVHLMSYTYVRTMRQHSSYYFIVFHCCTLILLMFFSLLLSFSFYVYMCKYLVGRIILFPSTCRHVRDRSRVFQLERNWQVSNNKILVP